MTTETIVNQVAGGPATGGELVNKDELVAPNEPPKEVVPPADEAKVEDPAPKAEDEAPPAEDAPETPEPAEYVSYGHAGADAAVAMLKEANVSPEDAQAIFKGIEGADLSKVDVTALAEKVGQTKADLIMAGIKDYVSTEVAKASAIETAVHTVVGGKEAMDKITTWLKTERAKNPDLDAEVKVYAEMMGQGPVQAKTAAKAILELYNNAGNTSGLNNNLTEGTSAGFAKLEVIDRPTFISKLVEAERTGNTAEATRLRQQRAASIKAGHK